MSFTVRKKCHYAKYYSSVFSSIRTKNGDLQKIRTGKIPNTDTFYAMAVCYLFDKDKVKFIWSEISVEAVAWRCSVEKMFLEISQNSQENTCATVSF